jgi:hypothetical protein
MEVWRFRRRRRSRTGMPWRATSYRIDGDGCWVLKGRFTPEQGAVTRQALEKALDEQFAERAEEHPDVSAENARQVLSLSDEKGLEITAKSLWTEWTGEPIDYNYAQGILAQYDPDGR